MKPKFLEDNNDKAKCFILQISFKYCFRRREKQYYLKINFLIQEITKKESKNSKKGPRIYQTCLSFISI